jgi:hypothetical protein
VPISSGSTKKLLYIDAEGRCDTFPSVGTDLHVGDGLLMFWSHAPIAPWQDASWIEQMRRSLRPNQYLRMIENRFVTAESTFIDLDAWDACVDPSTRRGDRQQPAADLRRR